MHLDTVIGYRQRYLQEFGRKETDPRFLQRMPEARNVVVENANWFLMFSGGDRLGAHKRETERRIRQRTEEVTVRRCVFAIYH